MARRKQPVIPDQLLDQLLAGADAKAALDEKALAERALKRGDLIITWRPARRTAGPIAATATAGSGC